VDATDDRKISFDIFPAFKSPGSFCSLCLTLLVVLFLRRMYFGKCLYPRKSIPLEK
jgi:hypothetical protein